jgi:hypothetical protein
MTIRKKHSNSDVCNLKFLAVLVVCPLSSSADRISSASDQDLFITAHIPTQLVCFSTSLPFRYSLSTEQNRKHLKTLMNRRIRETAFGHPARTIFRMSLWNRLRVTIITGLHYRSYTPATSAYNRDTLTWYQLHTHYYYYYYYYHHHHHHHHHLFLFRSARSIGLRQCLVIQGSCFSFLDPLDIW